MISYLINYLAQYCGMWMNVDGVGPRDGVVVPAGLDVRHLERVRHRLHVVGSRGGVGTEDGRKARAHHLTD